MVPSVVEEVLPQGPEEVAPEGRRERMDDLPGPGTTKGEQSVFVPVTTGRSSHNHALLEASIGLRDLGGGENTRGRRQRGRAETDERRPACQGSWARLAKSASGH